MKVAGRSEGNGKPLKQLAVVGGDLIRSCYGGGLWLVCQEGGAIANLETGQLMATASSMDRYEIVTENYEVVAR